MKIVFQILIFCSCIFANAQDSVMVVDAKADQKRLEKNLKEAKVLSAITQKPNFGEARKRIEAAMQNSQFESYKADVLIEAGNVEFNCYEVERNKPAKGGKIDYAVLYPATERGFEYFDQAYNLLLESGKKMSGSVKSNLQKKAWSLFSVTDGFRVNAAYAYENKDWKVSHNCFSLFVDAVNSNILNDYAASNAKARQILNAYQSDSIIAHARYFRTISAIEMNDDSLAIKELEEIKYDGFEQNVVLQELCRIYRERNDEENLVRVLKEGTVLQPNEQWYSSNLVNIYLSNKDYVLADEFIDQLIAVDSLNAASLALKGQLVELQGNVDEAISYYEKSYAIDPDNMFINSNLGRFYYNQATAIESELRDKRRYAIAEEQSMPLFLRSIEYYLRAFELDEKHEDQTIAKAIRTIRYKQFSKADCPNKDELIQQYNAVSRAYGLKQFPR